MCGWISSCYISSPKVSYAPSQLVRLLANCFLSDIFLKVCRKGSGYIVLCLEFYDCLYYFIALDSVNSSPTLKLRLIFCTFHVAYASISVSRGFQCLCSLGTCYYFIWHLRNLLFTNSIHLYILFRFHVFLFSSLVIQIKWGQSPREDSWRQ